MFKLIIPPSKNHHFAPFNFSSFLLFKRSLLSLEMMALLFYFFIGISKSYSQIPSSYTKLSVNSLSLNRTGTKMTSAQLSSFGPAYKGYRWNTGDADTRKWRPQGISGYIKSGKKWSIVSWYGRYITGTVFCDEDYRNRGSRISFVDITDMDNIHYRHVLLVDENGNTFYDMHAGGLTVVGDTLYTVDSRGSIDAMYSFCLDSIIAVPSADQGNYYGYEYILPKLSGADSIPFNPSFISYDWDDDNMVIGSFQNCPSNACATPENNRLIWFQPGAVDLTSNFYDGLFGKMQGLTTATNLDNSNKKDVWFSTSYGSGNNSRLYYFNYDFGTNTMQNQSIDYGNNYAYISVSPGLEDLHRTENDDLWTLSEFTSDWPCGSSTSNVRSVVAYTRSALKPPGACDGDIITDLSNELDIVACTQDTLSYYLPQMNDISYIDFNPGASDVVWVNADTLATPLTGSSRSVFMWVKQDISVSNDPQTLFAINTGTGGNVTLLNIRTNEKLAIFDGGTNHDGTTTITDGNWHHVGYTYEQSTGETKLYVDGTVENTFTDSQPVNTTDLISIGQEYDSGLAKGNYSESRMTEISIWDDVLTAADIALFANNPIVTTHPKIGNLIAYYNANKSCGDNLTILNDVSGNGYDSQVYGLIGDHGIEALSVDSIETIPAFNSISYFNVDWLENGTSISTDDSLQFIPGISNTGAYSLELRRDPFVYTDSWDIQFQTITGTDTQVACDSYDWIDGNTYTASNSTATHTLTNAAGCDSVVTLNLTINNSSTGTDTQITCDSYDWIDGNTYTASNSTATHTLTNAAGCDSVVTLNLTINNSSMGTDTQVACDSYDWIDGNTYTASNSTATHTLTNTAGCDSVVTLNLTINNSSTGTDTQVACDSYDWIDGNTYTASNSTATHTLTNAAGCDSVVTLNLTINTIDNTVSIVEPTITANAAGAIYQWIDCDNNNSPITGETNQSFTVTINGDYAVEITGNGCTDTSDCIAIQNIGIIDNQFGSELFIFPNPTFGEFQIDLGKLHTDIVIEVTDNTGRIMSRQTFDSAEKIDWKIEEPAGLYILKITTLSKSTTLRILKK